MEEIESVIREALRHIHQLTTQEGLFKTYRIDYSEEGCINDFIDEGKARFIDTKYDHAFILDILFRLKDYFPSEEKFLDLLQKGIKLIMDDTTVNEQIIDGKNVKTLQWRYYNIPHEGHALILPDIDNTARNLIVLERVMNCYGNLIENKELIHEYNYKQFLSLLTPLNIVKSAFSDSDYVGFLTYFGGKEDNDVDLFCNISTLYSIIVSNNLKHFDVAGKISDYINASIDSENMDLEYYTFPMAVYNYSKLFEICKEKGLIDFIPNAELRGRINSSAIKNLDGAKNPLEIALLVTSLLILGHRGPKIEEGIRYILKNRREDHSWDAYRFYRQRHPYRIFGSRGLSTAICLECLWYWERCQKE